MGEQVQIKKIAIVGTAGLPANYGGFETLSNHLTINLSGDVEFYVFCPKTPSSKKLNQYNNAKLIYLPFRANGYQSVLYDTMSILISLFFCDKILILGSGASFIFPVLFLSRHKLILNFGGLEWKREKWGLLTRSYLKVSEFIGVQCAKTVVVDNQYFVDYVRRQYKKPVVLIEYGGDHCHYVENIPDFLIQKYPFLNERFSLSVSRAQEDNNIHLLLEAFYNFEGMKLVVISNWDSSHYGQRLKKTYGQNKNIILLDAIYDINALNAIRSRCYLYIHSHSQCGTAPSLVEIMNLAKPVISFSNGTNHETTENAALYFKSVDELVSIIKQTSDSTYKNIGNMMKEIADRRYTWGKISKKYLELFN